VHQMTHGLEKADRIRVVGRMKKVLVVPLDDEQLLELCRILLDRDERGALQFLDEHLKKPANEALTGG
jgi:hypothetical protein